MSALFYAAFAALCALVLMVRGAVDCYEECRYDVPNPPWWDDIDAWQWDAIFWLGVASGVAAIVFLVAVWWLGTWIAAVVLFAQVSFVVAGGAFVRAAGDIAISGIVLVAVGLVAPGAALIASRASFRAGARGTRADPSA